jgi:hypothetical protein
MAAIARRPAAAASAGAILRTSRHARRPLRHRRRRAPGELVYAQAIRQGVGARALVVLDLSLGLVVEARRATPALGRHGGEIHAGQGVGERLAVEGRCGHVHEPEPETLAHQDVDLRRTQPTLRLEHLATPPEDAFAFGARARQHARVVREKDDGMPEGSDRFEEVRGLDGRS